MLALTAHLQLLLITRLPLQVIHFRSRTNLTERIIQAIPQLSVSQLTQWWEEVVVPPIMVGQWCRIQVGGGGGARNTTHSPTQHIKQRLWPSSLTWQQSVNLYSWRRLQLFTLCQYICLSGTFFYLNIFWTVSHGYPAMVEDSLFSECYLGLVAGRARSRQSRLSQVEYRHKTEDTSHHLNISFNIKQTDRNKVHTQTSRLHTC